MAKKNAMAGLVLASPARSAIFSTGPSARRIARMHAKAPSVIAR